MKKSGIIMLLLMFLSFSALAAAESPEGFSNSLENILNQTAVENQVVEAPVFGGVTVLSVSSSEQISSFVNVPTYVGFEVGSYTVGLHINNRKINNTDESREGTLLFAGMG